MYTLRFKCARVNQRSCRRRRRRRERVVLMRCSLINCRFGFRLFWDNLRVRRVRIYMHTYTDTHRHTHTRPQITHLKICPPLNIYSRNGIKLSQNRRGRRSDVDVCGTANSEHTSCIYRAAAKAHKIKSMSSMCLVAAAAIALRIDERKVRACVARRENERSIANVKIRLLCSAQSSSSRWAAGVCECVCVSSGKFSFIYSVFARRKTIK